MAVCTQCRRKVNGRNALSVDVKGRTLPFCCKSCVQVYEFENGEWEAHPHED